MPRAAKPWLRLYVETIDDWKIRRLTPSERWVWIAMLAFARKSVRPGYLLVTDNRPASDQRLTSDCSAIDQRLTSDCSLSDSELASYADVPLKVVRSALAKMERAQMIRKDPDLGAWHIINFENRQFESDKVSVRTAKHRSQEQRRNVPTDNVGTPFSVTDTDTDTETETEVKERVDFTVATPLSVVEGAPKRKKAKAIPEDFELTEQMRAYSSAIRAEKVGADLESEFERFRDYHTAKGTTHVDWAAAWRYWISGFRPTGAPSAASKPTNRLASLIGQIQDSIQEG